MLEEIGKLTPEEFEKHSREKEGGPRKWKSNIWVTIKGKKVPLWKSGLMRYYKHASNEGKLGSSSRRRGTFHRDEFLLCSKCKKERRFRLRTKQECKAFHYASMIKKWKCSDHPYDKWVPLSPHLHFHFLYTHSLIYFHVSFFNQRRSLNSLVGYYINLLQILSWNARKCL